MTSAIFSAKPIAAKALSDAVVRAHVLNALKETARDINIRLMMIVSTWEHKPVFSKPKIRYAGGDAHVTISTNSDIFRYLDEGTRIRWALLSRDWRSKTSPGGGYQSGSGQGHVWLKGRNSILSAGLSAGHGIEARNWTGQLAWDTSIVLSYRMDYALSKVATK